MEWRADVKCRARRIQSLHHFIVHRKLGSQVSTIMEKFMTMSYGYSWLPSDAKSGLGIFSFPEVPRYLLLP